MLGSELVFDNGSLVGFKIGIEEVSDDGTKDGWMLGSKLGID
jgi:hypothetical protein